jgi:integrase/recombinase XerD
MAGLRAAGASSRASATRSIALTRRAETELARRPIDRAVLFRDGLLIAFLAMRPIRRKNLANLVVGIHLTQTAAGWRLYLPAAEVKNRVEYDRNIPPEVGVLLDRYLAEYRPILLGGQHDCATNVRLWISCTGRPLRPDQIWKQVSARTGKEFGQPVPPHVFRDCAMTTWALDLPKQVRAGIHVLGNHSFAVAENAYNMAGSNIAAAKLQGVVATFHRACNKGLKRRLISAMPKNQQR